MKAGIDYIGVSVGAFILNNKGELLLLKRSQNSKNEKGKWEAPGGAVEFWEKRTDAIKREVKEELDIEIEIVDVLEVIDEMLPQDKQHWLATSYLVKIKGKQKPRIVESHKHDDMNWFSINNLPKPMSKVTSADIGAYKKRLGR